MRVNSAFHLEIEVPQCGGRVEEEWRDKESPMWSFYSQWRFEVPCHCWCWSSGFPKSTVNTDICQTAKNAKSCFNDHHVPVLDLPENSSYLNPRENLWAVVERKSREAKPNKADDQKQSGLIAYATVRWCRNWCNRRSNQVLIFCLVLKSFHLVSTSVPH